MATSSITANFVCRDAVESKRFVTAFLSGHTNRPFDRPDFKFVSGVENLKRQINEAKR